MRMPEQTNLRIERRKILAGSVHVQDIFPDWMVGTAMHQRKMVVDANALRQFCKPSRVLRRELLAGPQHRACRIGIEIGEIDLWHHGVIVIAGNRDQIEFAQTVDAFVGLGTIIDDIAQRPNAIKRPRVIDDRVQRFKLACTSETTRIRMAVCNYSTTPCRT